MFDPIKKFPKGTVIGSARLVKGDRVIDITRIKYGSMTRFVTSVTRNTIKQGPVRVAFNQTDEFPSDKIANRFIKSWLSGRIDNAKLNLVHKDEKFDTYNSLAQN